MTLILGIGNTLRCDEGAGIHAMHRFEQSMAEVGACSDDYVFIDGGTLSFTLARYIEDCSNLVVFDAAELNSPPGTVKLFTGEDMDNFLGKVKRSPHEVGLLDLLDIARLTESLPHNRALVGIQPQSLGWDMQPSQAVSNALPQAVNAAQSALVAWGCLQSAFHDSNTTHRSALET